MHWLEHSASAGYPSARLGRLRSDIISTVPFWEYAQFRKQKKKVSYDSHMLNSFVDWKEVAVNHFRSVQLMLRLWQPDGWFINLACRSTTSILCYQIWTGEFHIYSENESSRQRHTDPFHLVGYIYPQCILDCGPSAWTLSSSSVRAHTTSMKLLVLLPWSSVLSLCVCTQSRTHTSILNCNKPLCTHMLYPHFGVMRKYSPPLNFAIFCSASTWNWNGLKCVSWIYTKWSVCLCASFCRKINIACKIIDLCHQWLP